MEPSRTNRRERELPVWTVAEITRNVRALLESRFDFVRVCGQVSNLSRPASGHLYFSLLDDAEGGRSRFSTAQLGAVVWRNTARRLRFRLEDGVKVVATGRLTVYEPRGVYQLVVDRVDPVGVGELQLAFEELKERLATEGLFDASRKRPLPFLPRRIGLVTSPSGAAVRDFLRLLYRRHPQAWVRLVPVRVQGDGAREDVIRALALLETPEPQVDVIVLTRGGGSLEDLWTFNEEGVARAVARCSVPTVSAVGHEVDFTIADFVADVRAATPTAAAECVVPEVGDLLSRLDGHRQRLVRGLRRVADRAQLTLDGIGRSRALQEPQAIAQKRLEAVERAFVELRKHLYNRLDRCENQRIVFAARLGGLSPYRVLGRGYSVTTDANGNVVRSASVLRRGDEVRLRFREGRARATVEDTEPAEDTVLQGPGDS